MSGVAESAGAFKKKAEMHRNRIVMIKFFRDHLVPDETYRLDINDLERIEILKSRYDY